MSFSTDRPVVEYLSAIAKRHGEIFELVAILEQAGLREAGDLREKTRALDRALTDARLAYNRRRAP